MNSFETLIASGIVGGAIVIPFVDYVTRYVTSQKLTYAIALVSCIVMATIVAFIQGKMTIASLENPNTILVTLSSVFVTSQTLFNLYWKDSLMREKFNQRTIKPAPVQQPIAQTGETEITN